MADWDDAMGRNPPRRPTDMTLYERARLIQIARDVASESTLTDTPVARECRELLARIGVTP